MLSLVVSMIAMAPMVGEWEPVVMDVSAYCPCAKCCGEHSDGLTASGHPAEGKLVAAPKTYEFGTEMRVPGYGQAVVRDRGGAIKTAGEWVRDVKIGDRNVPDTRLSHDRIDLLFPTHDDALKWGRKTVVVWVKRPQ
jgi:3D (Asp-Asp-Asp) domain-containing protein